MRKRIPVAVTAALAGVLGLASITSCTGHGTTGATAPSGLRITGPTKFTIVPDMQVNPWKSSVTGGKMPYKIVPTSCTENGKKVNPFATSAGWVHYTIKGNTETGVFSDVWGSAPGVYVCPDVVTDATGATAKSSVTATVLSTMPSNSLVGAGSGISANLFDQFSASYNATRPERKLYNWDATNPITGKADGKITARAGCASAWPDGSAAGTSALRATSDSAVGEQCIDFARSSAGREASNSADVSFLQIASYGVTYARETRTNAPNDLTVSNLAGIYTCKYTTWNAIPGHATASHDTIVPVLPQAGSETRSFFLRQLGVSSPGHCVINGTSPSGGTTPIGENEGVNPVFTESAKFGLNPKNIISPFSIGAWLTQQNRSAGCIKTDCSLTSVFKSPNSAANVACLPTGGQNIYGCAANGALTLDGISGNWPAANDSPTVGSGKTAATNPFFTGDGSTSQRAYGYMISPLYVVAGNTAKSTRPGTTSPVGALAHYICTSPTAAQDLARYGFLNSMYAHGAACGTAS